VLKAVVLISILAVSSISYGLQPIPMDKVAGYAPHSPLRTLQAIQQDPRFETCRQDLQHFVANLSAKDLKEIQQQKENFTPDKLTQILKSKVNKAALESIEVDDFMKGVSILIPHGKMKCQISIYPELDIDQIKANIDPTTEDLKIKDGPDSVVEVQATLVGVSTTAEEGSGIHYDPSKAMTIMRQNGVEDLNAQIKMLEEFQNLEAAKATEKNSPKAVK
jgi:hypothetical protein